MGSWAWVFVILAVAALGIMVRITAAKARRKDLQSRLNALPGFVATQQVMGCDMRSGIAVDVSGQKICLITEGDVGLSLRILLCKDVLSVDIFEDGASITRTVRSSQIGGAVVGGLALGGVGAIIGGLSGQTETSSKIRRVDLRLVVNDTKAPLHDVAFMNAEIEKDGNAYAQAIELARCWQGIVEVLIRRADAEEKLSQIEQHPAQSVPPTSSVADEIRKLADLHSSGVLTLEEFQQQKTRLLSADPPVG